MPHCGSEHWPFSEWNCLLQVVLFYKDTPCIVSIQEPQSAVVGIWWTIQMPVWTFLLSNRRYQGRCLSSLARNKQPTLNPTANLIFRIVSCILQRFWCIGWVCGSLSCLCLYKSSRKWLKPQSDRLTGQVGSCLRSLFWRSPIAKICSFTDVSRFYDGHRRHFNAALDKVITFYHHHCLSSSCILIIMIIIINNNHHQQQQQHLGKLNPSLSISDYFDLFCILHQIYINIIMRVHTESLGMHIICTLHTSICKYNIIQPYDMYP